MIGDIKSKYDSLSDVKDIKNLNGLTLAYVGDAVYDLYVRSHLIHTGDFKTGKLHLMAIAHVKAAAQAAAYDVLEGMFTEEEAGIAQRAKNVKNATIPKNANPKDYKKATALEAVIGYLYLCEQRERLIELLDAAYAANKDKKG